MSDSPDSSVIAVDGGGTKCRVTFACGDTRHSAELGPANVNTDFAAAIAEIADGLQKIASTAGTTMDALAVFQRAGYPAWEWESQPGSGTSVVREVTRS